MFKNEHDTLLLNMVHERSGAVLDDDAGDETVDKVMRMCCSDHAAETSDDACHAADAGSGDAKVDETLDMSTQDPATEPVVDEVGSETAQHGDDIQTSDALMSNEAAQINGDVQPSGDSAADRKTWYFADIKQQWRKFNIDLMPKVVADD